MSNGVLELTILAGIDERVDETVHEQHHRRQVVVPVPKVDGMRAPSDNDQRMVRGEANDEAAAYQQRRDNGAP